MALLPNTRQDQIKLVIGVVAVALTVAYVIYPHAARTQQIAADTQRLSQLEVENSKVVKEFSKQSIESLRSQAAENRAALLVMRRLVPTGQEVPALLEEVSTAARRAGLDVGGVTPEPVITGDRFDTYRYTVTIIGGYHEFGAFLANVGSLARIVAPVSFSMFTSAAYKGNSPIKTAQKGALASTIMLQTYVERTAPPRRTAPREKSS